MNDGATPASGFFSASAFLVAADATTTASLPALPARAMVASAAAEAAAAPTEGTNAGRPAAA